MTEPPSHYNQEHDDSSSRPGMQGPHGTENHSGTSSRPSSQGPHGTENHSGTSSRPSSQGSEEAEGRTHDRVIQPGDLLVGERYKVQTIKYGGMGVVYKCLDTWTQDDVGLKTVQTEGVMSNLKTRLMQRNYSLVHGLLHDHIVRVNNLERDDTWGQWFMVMDWVDGDDLESRLIHTQGNSLSAEETIRLLRQVADALDYAHGKSVVHRDVKCANIMVKANGDVQLIDFDIAKRAAPAPRGTQNETGTSQGSTKSKPTTTTTTTSDSFAGTRGYQSPEQWRGEKVTAASDQYSLAVTAYRCLSGHLPFWNSNEGQLMEMVQHEEVPKVGTLPIAANAVLAKGLSKQPKDRYANCMDFINELATSLGINKPQGKIDLSDFYFFVGTVERYRKEIERLEWDRGQTFGQHLDAFFAAFAAASEARGDRNYEAAYYCLKQAENEWKWLEFKRPLREQATARFAIVQQAREKAEKQEAERYAKVVYKEALQKQDAASAHFEEGEFREAMNEAYVAEGTFGEAEKSAHENHIYWLERSVSELVGQNKYEECEEIIHELSLLDETKAKELALSIKNSKNDCISEKEKQIQNAINEKRFAEADEICQNLVSLATEKSESWKESIRQAKNARVNELQQMSTALIAKNRFNEAITFIKELTLLEPSKAAEWETRIQASKSIYVSQLEKDINDFLAQHQFKEAKEIIERLAWVSEQMAHDFEEKFENAKNVRIKELEQIISDETSQKHFAEAIVGINELSALDKKKAETMMKTVEESRDEFVMEIDQLLEDDILTYRFDDAEKMVRQFELLDAEKAGRWREAVAASKNSRIDELKQIVRESLSHKLYQKAKDAVLKLHPLDEATANECEKLIQASITSEINRLKQKIYADISRNRFNEANEIIKTLTSLSDKKEEIEKLAAYVALSKEKEINRLEQIVVTAIAQKRFDEATEASKLLHLLDEDKAYKAEKAVEIAKVQEIAKLKQTILESIETKSFSIADRSLGMLVKLNAAMSDELKGKVATEKEKYSRDLEHDIGEAVIGKRLKEAIEGIQELETLDKTKADNWWKIFKSSVADCIQELEITLGDAVRNSRFDTAEDLIQQLEKINQDTGDKWRKVVEAEKNKHIQEAERIASDALEKRAFDAAFNAIGPLSSLNIEKYKKWNTTISNVKIKCIEQYKQQMVEALEAGRIEQAENIIRKLYDIDIVEAKKHEEGVAEAKNQRIEHLKQKVKEAVRNKRYDEASHDLLELENLTPTLADALAEEIENDRNAYIDYLKQSISNCIGKNQFTTANNALFELKRLEVAEIGDIEGFLISAMTEYEKEMTEKRLKAVRRKVAILIIIVVASLLTWIIKSSIHKWRRQQVLQKVNSIYEELVSKKAVLGDLAELDGKIKSLENVMISMTLNSPTSTLSEIKEEISRHQDYNERLTTLKSKVADVSFADLKKEWERKAIDLKPSENAESEIDKIADRFNALLLKRNDRMLSAINDFDKLLKMTPNTLGNLIHTDHNMSLKALRDFIATARYILFWYDEKNIVDLPFDIDKAWMNSWEPGKVYSGNSAEADCRHDALAKAADLKSKMKTSGQWESWFKQLWSIQDIWAKNGLDAARYELDDLDRKSENFGRFQNDFKKALSEIKNMVLQNEARQIEADVKQKKKDVTQILAYIGDKPVMDKERRDIKACEVKIPSDKDLEQYLESCKSDIDWINGVCNAMKTMDDVTAQYNQLALDVQQFEINLDNLEPAEMKHRLALLKERCDNAANSLSNMAVDAFVSQRRELSKRLSELYQNARVKVVSRAQKILTVHITSLKEKLKEMEEHSLRLIAKDYQWNSEDMVSNENAWYQQRKAASESSLKAMGVVMSEDDDSQLRLFQEAEELHKKIVGMANDAKSLLLPVLTNYHKSMSAYENMERGLYSLQQELNKLEREITTESLKKIETELVNIKQEREKAGQWLPSSEKTRSAFLSPEVVSGFDKLCTELAERLAKVAKRMDEMNAHRARAKSLLDGIENLERQVSAYEKIIKQISENREGNETHCNNMYQDIQKSYDGILAVKSFSNNNRPMLGKRQREQVDSYMERADKAKKECQEIFGQMFAFEKGMNELEGNLKMLDGKIDGLNTPGTSSADEEAIVDEYLGLKQKVNSMETFSWKQSERKQELSEKCNKIAVKMQTKLKDAFSRHERNLNIKFDEWSNLMMQLEGMKSIPADKLFECHHDILSTYEKLQFIPLKEEAIVATKEKYKEDLDRRVTKHYRQTTMLAVYGELAGLCNDIEKNGGMDHLSQDARGRLENLVDMFRNAEGLDSTQWKNMTEIILRQIQELKTKGQSQVISQTQLNESKIAYLKVLRDSFLKKRIDFMAWYDFLNVAMNENKEFYEKLSQGLALEEKITEALQKQSHVLQEIEAKNIPENLKMKMRTFVECFDKKKLNDGMENELKVIDDIILYFQKMITAGKAEAEELKKQIGEDEKYNYEKRLHAESQTLTENWNVKDNVFDDYRRELNQLYGCQEFLPIGIAIHQEKKELIKLYRRLNEGKTVNVQELDNVFNTFSELCRRGKRIKNLPPEINAFLDETMKLELKDYNTAREIITEDEDD